MASLLIVDDEPVLAHQLAVALRSAGHHVQTAGTAAEGLATARAELPELVLLDLRLPDRSGLDVIPDLKSLDSNLSIVLMTAFGSVRDAVEAMRLGAADYLTKPLDVAELGLLIERLLERRRLDRELAYHRSRDAHRVQTLNSEDPKICELFSTVGRLCDADLPPGRRPTILLTGETGVGKGVAARVIHEMLGGGPFLELACSGVPSEPLGMELFGRGRERANGSGSEPGLLEAAEGGTLLLDEIGDLDLDLQAKLLRVIDERRVERADSTHDREVNVHILAATHDDLDLAVAEGRFRADLLHRLRVLSFVVPPLRERPRDLVSLASQFATEFGRRYGGAPRKLSSEALEKLLEYAWPGNVRELRNVLERAVLVNDEPELGADAVSALLAPQSSWAPPGRVILPEEGVRLEDVERDLLRQALERTRGNRTRASVLLGVSRDTLRYRIGKWGLDKDS